MFQLQETDSWKKPATTTWGAEFLLREGESREFLGSCLHSSAVHKAKKRRTKQVISCSFPCGKWLHMIGARTSPGCELCKRERKTEVDATDIPAETVAHLQNTGCKSQKKSVIWAHNRCWLLSSAPGKPPTWASRDPGTGTVFYHDPFEQ